MRGKSGRCDPADRVLVLDAKVELCPCTQSDAVRLGVEGCQWHVGWRPEGVWIADGFRHALVGMTVVALLLIGALFLR